MLPDLARHTDKLFYFYEIANEGSFHGAARKIGISTPTLSYSVKQLEEIIDEEVFFRSQKGVSLTESGKTLLAFCHRFYRDMERMQLQIRKGSTERVERIRVGTFQSIAIYFWPILVEALGKDPNLSLSIKTNRSQIILEELIRRSIDIAVTVEDFSHEDLLKHELYKDHYAFFCSAKWNFPQLKADQTADYPILYIPDAIDEDRRTLRQHIYSWGLHFRDEFELDSLEVVGEFVKRGYGIGILPIRAAKIYGRKIRKLKIEGLPTTKFGTHRFFLSYRKDLDLPQKLMNSFLSAARKAVRTQK